MNSLKHRFSILAAVIIFYDVFFQLGSSILINSGASLYQNQFVAMGITGILAVILSAMFLSSFPRVNVKYRRFNLWHFLFCVLLMYGLQYISNFIMSPLISFLKEHGYTMTQLEANSSGRIIDGPDFIYSVFLAPILEECFFRGLVYKMVRPSGVFASGFFLGLLFGLSHLNLIQFLPAFLIGILLFAIRDTYGLPFSILLHVTNNFLVILLYNYASSSTAVYYLGVFLMLGGISLTLIYFILQLPKLFHLVQMERNSIKYAFSVFFTTPLMLVFIVLTVLLTTFSITYG